MKIGLLGQGAIGTRHYKNLIGLGHTALVHDPAKHGSVGRDEVIAKADAFVIATPADCHYCDLLDCMSTDKPIFVEKPLCLGADAFRDLHNYLSTYRLFVGYNLRFHRCVMLAKEWLETGRIGEPLWATLWCAQYNDKYREPVLLNWSHEIDLALYLLGSAELVWSDVDARNAKLLLDHAGARSAIYLNYRTRPQARGFVVIGTSGSIACDLVESVVELNSGRSNKVFYGTDVWERCYADEIKGFCDWIDGKATPGVKHATGDDAMAVLRLVFGESQ